MTAARQQIRRALDPSRRQPLVRRAQRELEALHEAQGYPSPEALTAREVLREELWRRAEEYAVSGNSAAFCNAALELVSEARAMDEAIELGTEAEQLEGRTG